MRLIDADKLHYKRVLLNDGTQSAVVVFAKEIDKAKKIEAIPIEWMYLWRLKNMDKCPTFYMPFSDLLNDWEKENGHSK